SADAPRGRSPLRLRHGQRPRTGPGCWESECRRLLSCPRIRGRRRNVSFAWAEARRSYHLCLLPIAGKVQEMASTDTRRPSRMPRPRARTPAARDPSAAAVFVWGGIVAGKARRSEPGKHVQGGAVLAGLLTGPLLVHFRDDPVLLEALENQLDLVAHLRVVEPECQTEALTGDDHVR